RSNRSIKASKFFTTLLQPSSFFLPLLKRNPEFVAQLLQWNPNVWGWLTREDKMKVGLDAKKVVLVLGALGTEKRRDAWPMLNDVELMKAAAEIVPDFVVDDVLPMQEVVEVMEPTSASTGKPGEECATEKHENPVWQMKHVFLAVVEKRPDAIKYYKRKTTRGSNRGEGSFFEKILQRNPVATLYLSNEE
ncbi:unnamed protein product, partial [Amoebophrya sp. A25]